MYHGRLLDLDSVIFEALRDEIRVSLNAALMLADKEGKEGEVNIKLKVGVATERTYEKGKLCKEWTEPRFSWVVSRKVKENKIDHKGSSMPGYELRFDDDGRPHIVEVNQQASLFEEPKTVIHYHFGEKKSEAIVDAETGDPEETTLDDDSRGIGGEPEIEQPDEVTEAANTEGEE